MKKLIFLILLMGGIAFGQITSIDGKTPIDQSVRQNPGSVMLIYNPDDDLFYPVEIDASGRIKVVSSITDTPFVQLASVSLTADSVTFKAPTTITNGTKTVGGTAAALAGSAVAKYVIITNNNASGTVYWGGTGVTTSTGEPIYPMMSATIPIGNVATVYVIGDAVTVRYKILN
ncbi:MAG: hypothetical protein NUV80_00220 [Candidatus Berkelbacteria bacterium]|nr:hypothetical protein [Candidatus Berkelbacteria bacterium]